jgi:hypothetical protein
MEQPKITVDFKTLLAHIGELTVANGLLKEQLAQRDQRIAELESRTGEATNKKPAQEKALP